MNPDVTQSVSLVSQTPPRWFWVTAAIALVWNLLGVAAFFAQTSMDTSTLPPAQQVFYDTMPSWALGGFAVAVFAGVLGCIALLLEKSWALPLFIASLLGLVVQVSHSIFVGNGLEVFGPTGFIMPIVIFAVTAALALFSKRSIANDWLS